MLRRRLGAALAVALLSLGLATTAFWLLHSRGALSPIIRQPGPLVLGLFLTAGLTSLNLAIRWLRWHFLLRRWKVLLKTKESAAIWLASLPGIATPFYIGELARAAFLTGRTSRPFWRVLGIWLVERLADLYVLGFAILAARGDAWVLLGIGAVTLLCVWVIRLIPHAQLVRTVTNPLVVAATAAGTALAWALPALGLWLVLYQLGSPLAADDVVEAFGVGTLLGGFSGVPLGVGVAGSAMILSLQAHGVPPELAAAAIAVFRAGTVWYAVGTGVLAFVLWRRHILPASRSRLRGNHFDRIARAYGENVPPHIVERLLVRKTDVMHAWLSKAGAPQGWRGLDVGCGQGWYIAKMAQAGYRMSGMDLSVGQIHQARAYLVGQGLAAPLCVSDISSLPYADGSFDFAFSVNVIHHIAHWQARQAALREIVRVLRPGGRFFLQEINIRNPLFRFYMGYVFPLLKDIDEGTEQWLVPDGLPEVEGGRWEGEAAYFNFLPDFTPAIVTRWLSAVEMYLERSRLSKWSSHYVACLTKDGSPAGPLARPSVSPARSE